MHALVQVMRDLINPHIIITKKKTLSNLPIFIGTLLLHLNILIQFAVRGTKVVIPLHVEALVFQSITVRVCALVLSARSAFVEVRPPQLMRLKRSAFPRYHFNAPVCQ